MYYYKHYFPTFFTIISLLFVKISCTTEDNNIKTVRVDVVNALSKFGDGSFLSLTSGIEVDEPYVYIADGKNDRIVVIDTQLSFVKSIGKSGSGPGEFNYVRSPKLFGNYIYAEDAGGGKINIFNKYGEYIRSVIMKIPIAFSKPFSINKHGHIIYSSFTSLKPVIVISDSGKVIREFGEYLPDTDGKIYRVRNCRFIFANEKNIITLCESLPFIEKYDEEGNLLVRKDLSLKYKKIVERIKQNQMKYKKMDEESKQRSVFVIFTSAYLKGDFLYAAFLKPEDEKSERQESFFEILKIDIHDLEVKEIIIPESKVKEKIWIRNIAKSENAIYLGADEIYKLYYNE